MSEQLFRAEDGAALRFFTKPKKNNFQSEKHGRMIFDTGLYVEVITPGSAESVPEFLCETTFSEEAASPPKRTDYYKRFAKQIEAYKEQNGSYSLNGTPLAAWPQIDVGTAATLRACGVQTVEQLSDVSDGNLHNLGIGGRTLREKAKQWISSREFGIPTAQAGTQIAELEQRVQALTTENEALRSQLAGPAPFATEAPTAAALEFGTAGAAGALSGAFPAPEADADPFAALSGPPKAPATVI